MPPSGTEKNTAIMAFCGPKLALQGAVEVKHYLFLYLPIPEVLPCTVLKGELNLYCFISTPLCFKFSVEFLLVFRYRGFTNSFMYSRKSFRDKLCLVKPFDIVVCLQKLFYSKILSHCLKDSAQTYENIVCVPPKSGNTLIVCAYIFYV